MDTTIESRLKKIRKELSLIDKDLESLKGVAVDPKRGTNPPRIRSRELREREEHRAESGKRDVKGSEREAGQPKAEGLLVPRPSKPVSVLKPQGSEGADKDERFLEYLSSSFNSGRPLRRERRIQRNKAIFMLIILLFILFILLYGVLF